MWAGPSTPSTDRKGNQAQQQNFRSPSTSSDPLSQISSPFIPFTPLGVCGGPLYGADQAVSTTPTPFNEEQEERSGLELQCYPCKQNIPLSLCTGLVRASGKDAVSLPRDNGGLGSCLRHNKETALLLVLFTLVSPLPVGQKAFGGKCASE